MQGLCMNEEYLYKVEQEIIDFCTSEDVKCKRVKGPSYEEPLHNEKDYSHDVIWHEDYYLAYI